MSHESQNSCYQKDERLDSPKKLSNRLNNRIFEAKCQTGLDNQIIRSKMSNRVRPPIFSKQMPNRAGKPNFFESN